MKKNRLVIIFILYLCTIQGFGQNQSQYISQILPEFIAPGEEFEFNITFKNTGNTVWEYQNYYHLGSQNPQDNTNWGTNRIILPSDVAPDEEITITATLTAPIEESVYGFQWRMVQDGVEWFGEASESLLIHIGVNMEADSLLSEKESFSVSDHIVSTSFFHWYTSDGGQKISPWIPINGRESWTGNVLFWKTMIKEVMAANIDVLYVELIPYMEAQRANLFLALNQLRREGWDVPKVCPFLDPEITYAILGYNGDASTEEGKDELIGHYIRFYEQYYSVNTDEYADDYIYTQENNPVLNIWHIQLHIDYYWQLNRDDVTSRLATAFGSEHPIFNNDIKMINNAYSPAFSFADERVYQFEMQEYKIDKTWNDITTSLLKPGYWDQNVRNPGFFLPRDGGIHYSNSWDLVNESEEITRVYIESFNEYDEGSGIYAARTDTIYKKTDEGMNNTEDDVWSVNDNPFEYIKTTAAGAALFNQNENLDSKIIWHNIPDSMSIGAHFTATVLVRNQGNDSWNNALGFQFGEQEEMDEVMFGPGRYQIDDTEDEISIYGGVFRGRTLGFQLDITAPDSIGIFQTHWSMLQANDQWFGETIVKNIQVFTPSGIGDIEQNTFIISPNPANNHIKIIGHIKENTIIEIYNIKGQYIQKEVLTIGVFHQIDISHLKKGIYFIRLGDKMFKFVKG